MKPWKTLARRQLLDAHPWLRVHAEKVQLPEGQVIEGFYTIEMPDYIVVVALTADGHVLVERNYKHGPRRVCLNVPAGYLHPNEPPVVAAQRELLEETGYQAETWVSLGSFTNDGNRGCGVGHFFLARNAHQVAEPQSGDLEAMQLGLMPLEELAHALHRGEVPVLSNAAAIALAIEVAKEAISA